MRLPAAVISIGNLTLGGTGKTPAVIALAEEAGSRGLNPCVLTRGYGGKAKRPCISTKDRKHFLKSDLVGDEAALMAYRLQGVPVVKGKNRFLAGMYAMGETGAGAIDCFILDDGFQHLALYRDLDILLIDATNPFGSGRVFPEGILREPVEALSRADIAVITKAEDRYSASILSSCERIAHYKPDLPVYTARHKPESLVHVTGKVYPLQHLMNEKVYAFAGIANTGYFASLLQELGAVIHNRTWFRDHHRYSKRDIERIVKRSGGGKIVTTEKDLIKLKDLGIPDNVFALRIAFTVEPAFYDRVFETVAEKRS